MDETTDTPLIQFPSLLHILGHVVVSVKTQKLKECIEDEVTLSHPEEKRISLLNVFNDPYTGTPEDASWPSLLAE